MIVLSPQTVLERIADVLGDTVLPELGSGYARGQSHAAIAMLRDVIGQWNDFTLTFLADNRGLARLLRRYLALPVVVGAGQDADADLRTRIGAALGSMQLRTAAYPVARADNIALRGLADQMLVQLDAREPDRRARSLRRALRRHLKAQVQRELRAESQEALGRMSRGS